MSRLRRAASLHGLLCLLFILGGLSTGVGAAAIARAAPAASQPCDTCLGPPMDVVSTASYFPLDGFSRIQTDLRQFGKPEVLFIGIDGALFSSLERWPLIKALDQFGSLSGAKRVDPGCTQENDGSFGRVTACGTPTFDLSHALYRSRYVRFVNKDVARYRGNKMVPYQRLSATERRLFRRYACHSTRLPCPSDRVTVNEPLVAVGNYLQTVSQLLTNADFGALPTATSPPSAGHELTFDQVHQALLQRRDPVGPSKLVEDVNAEANIITALICHADGKQPKKVCNRPVIKQILKHVK